MVQQYNINIKTIVWLYKRDAAAGAPAPIPLNIYIFLHFFLPFSSKNTKQSQPVHLCRGEFYPLKPNIKLDILHLRASWLSSVKSKTNKLNLQPSIGGIHPQLCEVHLNWVRSFPAHSRDIAHNQEWKCRNSGSNAQKRHRQMTISLSV